MKIESQQVVGSFKKKQLCVPCGRRTITQHKKLNFSENNAFKKETLYKRHRRPIKDVRFSRW
jgi:hypothetical protein